MTKEKLTKKNVQQKQKRDIINLDDPDLILPEIDSDENTECKREKSKNIIKQKRTGMKKMLEKAVNIDIEEEDVNIREETNKSKIENIFNYENKNIIIIVDSKGKLWCRGKDVADTLEYANTRKAIIKNVKEKNKKSLADVGVPSGVHLGKIDPQTIFIDQSGVFQLIMRSRKPEAEKFAEWLAEEVIPSLMTTGTYTMPIKNSDTEKLNKSFYDDNILSNYDNRPVIYFAYVGEHVVIINGVTKKEHVIKFGLTRKMSQRELDQHRNFYSVFNVLGIWETLANVEVETKIKRNFKSMNMLVDLKIKGKKKEKEENRTEHIVLNEVHDLDYCLKMIDNVVKTTTLPKEEEYKNKITELENENVLLKSKIKLLRKNEKLNQKYINRLESDINKSDETSTHLKKIVKMIGNKRIK